MFGIDHGQSTFAVVDDYFGGVPFVDEESGSYADERATTVHNKTVEHQHPLSEILSVLLAEGLVIRAYDEYDHTLFPHFPWLEQRGQIWHQPEGAARIPLMFALVAEG